MHRMTGLPIITCHRIVPYNQPKDPRRLTVSVGKFEHQIQYLYEHGYQCVSLEELLCKEESNQSVWRKRLLLTFDDGYEDFFALAYPILRRYGFTATVFLVTD